MTKSDVIATVAERTGITKKDATEFVNATFDVVVEGIITEGRVSISKLGTFEKKEIEERQGRNPQTGEAMVIPAHGAAKFKPAKYLKDALR